MMKIYDIYFIDKIYERCLDNNNLCRIDELYGCYFNNTNLWL